MYPTQEELEAIISSRGDDRRDGESYALYLSRIVIDWHEKKHAEQEPWRPDVCPITGRNFFLWIEHWETGQMVPTYGGPFDSYTIPEKDVHGDYICERYDHDRGGWLVDECEDVGVMIVSNQLYTTEDDPAALTKQRDELLDAAKAVCGATNGLTEMQIAVIRLQRTINSTEGGAT